MPAQSSSTDFNFDSSHIDNNEIKLEYECIPSYFLQDIKHSPLALREHGLFHIPYTCMQFHLELLELFNPVSPFLDMIEAGLYQPMIFMVPFNSSAVLGFEWATLEVDGKQISLISLWINCAGIEEHSGKICKWK